MIDAAIIGGGPAGATAARLLAAWGHRVAVLNGPPGSRPSLAECLPPSTRKLFQFLGIDREVDAAGFFRTAGNTVWWGDRRRVEPYPAGFGYQVLRSDFDRQLLELARSAGARVRAGKAVYEAAAGGVRIELQNGERRTLVRAKFFLDCSGRAGVIARSFRTKGARARTVALCGIWRNEAGWKLPDATHTLVEAYGDGWAWSVPLSPVTRHVAFMVGPGETSMARGKGLTAAYLAEMAKTRAFRRIFAHGNLEPAPWGRDASLYSAKRFCGRGFLLVGDAGSCIDPLSSFGVKKAMVSGWVAAVTTHTCLTRPAMQDAALQFFEERERQVFEGYSRQSAGWFRESGSGHPFWAERSGDPEREERPGIGAQRALEELRRKESIRLRRADGVRVEQRPAIEGREIVMRDVLVVTGEGRTLDFLASVDLPRLAEMAEHHTQVPDLFEAYNRVCAPAPLPNFLTALASLIAEGVLEDR